jgi:outer membrane immunogenic protein
MRNLFVASAAVLAVASVPAIAADLPVKAAPPAAPAPVFSWTGCYLGIEGGGAWGHSQHITAPPSADETDVELAGFPISDSYRMSGGLVGGTIGCNFQVGKVVVGAEGDLSWVSKKGSAHELPTFDPDFIDGTKEQWLGTFRGRAGYAFSPEILAFISGGFALAGIEASVDDVPDALIFTDRKTQFGWTVGGGIEWAFLQNWSAKVEYLYVRLEDATFFEAPIVATPSATTIITRFVPLDDHIVRVGLNFHFWAPPPPAPAAPVAAKY